MTTEHNNTPQWMIAGVLLGKIDHALKNPKSHELLGIYNARGAKNLDHFFTTPLGQHIDKELNQTHHAKTKENPYRSLDNASLSRLLSEIAHSGVLLSTLPSHPELHTAILHLATLAKEQMQEHGVSMAIIHGHTGNTHAQVTEVTPTITK